MSVINAEFGNMRSFLWCWSANQVTAESSREFIRKGSTELISLWLPEMADRYVPSYILDNVKSTCQRACSELAQDQDSILRSACKGQTEDREDNKNSLPTALGAMRKLVCQIALMVWELLNAIVLGNEAEGSQMKVLSSFMILLYVRNQCLNSYQMQMGVFLKACHMTNVGINSLDGTGFCYSEKHVQNSMSKVDISIGGFSPALK